METCAAVTPSTPARQPGPFSVPTSPTAEEPRAGVGLEVADAQPHEQDAQEQASGKGHRAVKKTRAVPAEQPGHEAMPEERQKGGLPATPHARGIEEPLNYVSQVSFPWSQSVLWPASIQKQDVTA